MLYEFLLFVNHICITAQEVLIRLYLSLSQQSSVTTTIYEEYDKDMLYEFLFLATLLIITLLLNLAEVDAYFHPLVGFFENE